jgi:hypothetical protein
VHGSGSESASLRDLNDFCTSKFSTEVVPLL